ncbi:MAG: hypothetical protein ACK5Q5_08730 [Planctomycetaceae bacterium]
MSTTTEPRTVLPGVAHDLISCFYDGVDVLVYQLAEQMARIRTSTAPPEPVRIEFGDVRSAGCRVVQAIQKLSQGNLVIPPDIQSALRCSDADSLNDMTSCFDLKTCDDAESHA